MRALAQRGDLESLAELIEGQYFRVLSNRDYRWTNELLVKFAFLTLLFDDRLYMAVSELETERGYVDLALILRSDKRHVQALDLLLEFKYLSLKALELSGEQLREQSREALAELAPVAGKLDETFGRHSATLYRIGGKTALKTAHRAGELGQDTIKLAATYGGQGLHLLDRVGAIRFVKYSARASKIAYKGDLIRLIARALIKIPTWLLPALAGLGIAVWIPWRRLRNRVAPSSTAQAPIPP